METYGFNLSISKNIVCVLTLSRRFTKLETEIGKHILPQIS